MKKESLKLHAYNSIKEKIVSCEYSPGMLLNEELLRESIGASRTPIRDALSRLEQEGLISIMPKKGVVVSELSIGEVNMIFEVRLLVEPYALENYGASIPEQTVMEHFSAFTRAANDKTARDVPYELDDSFHRDIVSACANRFLMQTYESIQTQNRRFRVMTGTIQDNRLEITTREHLQIIRACIKRDWKLAGQAMREHLLASKDATFELLLNASARYATEQL